jgi:hypothetical protein
VRRDAAPLRAGDCAVGAACRWVLRALSSHRMVVRFPSPRDSRPGSQTQGFQLAAMPPVDRAGTVEAWPTLDVPRALSDRR